MKGNTLGRVNILLMIGAMGCLVCYDIFGGLWLKGVTSLWFVVLGGVNCLAARNLAKHEKSFFLLMWAGMFCGCCADVLLGLVFVAGVGVFALGHVLYLAAFFRMEKPRKQDLWYFLPMAAVSLFIVVGTPWINVEDPVMEKVLLGYAVVIAAMVAKALSNFRVRPSRARALIALGSLMFWFSDLVLAVDMFGQSSRLTWVLCSYSYWPAQSILAHSLFHKQKEV